MENLSREELLELVKRQQEQLDTLLNPPPNDWHSWFYALLMIKLHKFFPAVTVEREILLGAQPPRADFLVLKESEKTDLGLGVFRIFRKHNILEFKSPDDELNRSVLWKVIGYAGFYISMGQIDEDEVTITLLRAAKPEKLFRELGMAISADEETKGVYHIRQWFGRILIQVVVTSELEGADYAGFRAISKKPSIEDVLQVMQEYRSDFLGDSNDYYQDYMELLSRFDPELMETVKRRGGDMEHTAILNIYKPEIDALCDEAMEKGEERMGRLMLLLVSAGRNDDLIAAASDPAKRIMLYKEFHLDDADEQ
ncbi:MAG: hypothetical protein J6N53_06310 [Lachnospiraceae bacterium]|nr:hypothetical protein [Lachnospiraceae bacterium]